MRVNIYPMASDAVPTQTITSDERNKSVPVVTVESFFNTHSEKLAMRLEGPRVGFHRKIREPTINRPGLALSGFFTYFAEKRVQVLGAAENTYLKSLSSSVRVKRFRALCEQKIPCLVVSRGAHLDEALMTVALAEQIAVFSHTIGNDEVHQRCHNRVGNGFLADGDGVRKHGRYSRRRRFDSRRKRNRQERVRPPRATSSS